MWWKCIWVKHSKIGVWSHLAAQPQRETIHAATWTAKGSEHAVPAFLFCSSSINWSITLITSSVRDCKETVDINYMLTAETELFKMFQRTSLSWSKKGKTLPPGLTIDFSCSGFMAGSCCERRQALWKRSKKAVRSADGSQAGTSQNRSEMTSTFTIM